MTAVGFALDKVYLEALPAPDTFSTTSGRNCLVDPWGIPLWARFACVIPAFFVTILVFLDQNITARLVNNPDNKLHKGEAYHLDLLVVGGLIAVCSFFGLPWLVAATVRSLNHVRSLAEFEDISNVDGEMENKIVSIRETRITGFMIHLLLAAVLFILPVIKQIPMAILYGLFLYMGIVSMKGNQFFERLSLWIMDSNLYPKKHYIRKVSSSVIHKFTFIQLFALVLLWIVKVSPLGILFPLFIAFLVPLRRFITRFFTPEDLVALDSEEEPEDEELHWA